MELGANPLPRFGGVVCRALWKGVAGPVAPPIGARENALALRRNSQVELHLECVGHCGRVRADLLLLHSSPSFRSLLAMSESHSSSLRESAGYRGAIACSAAGISYRQLDYWARTGLVEPSIRTASGSGTSRLYSFRDILVLKIVKRLLDTGISLQNVRSAVEHLRARGTEDLATLTLMSDGASIYECASADDVIDLLAGGQGVFGIAIGTVWREVEGTLAKLPSEEEGVNPIGAGNDELSIRRSRKGA